MEDPMLELDVIRTRRPRRNIVIGDGCERASNESCPPKEKTNLQTHRVQAELVPVDKKDYLGYLSTAALIFNKTIGSGIFLSPAAVLAATNSKDISLVLWIIGCLMTWAGMFIYLEYGLRWPVTGGELYYIDKVWTKPIGMFTYVFASMFVIANGVHNNALIFAKEVLLAGSNGDDPINTNLQKFLAIVIVTFVCQLLAFSRFIYIKISNLIAIFKISVLCFIVLLGFVAIDGARVHSSTTINTTYGKQNLSSDFGSRTGNPYQYSLAMLNIMRAFLGYENANFVLNEIRTGPKSDERRTFRRAVKIAVATICFLYVMVNFAFFAACTSEEIINQPETLIIFLEKIFGPSNGARLASSIIVSISAAGAILALTFANARVKQEIGRLGILPFPEFWCKTSHRRTPTRALLLHWIFTVLFIIIAPLDMSNGFAVISTFYSYVHTYISIMLGIALLCAPWLPSFQYTNREDGRFRPESSKLGYWLLGPLAIVYIATNFAVLALSWFPVNEQQVLDTTESTLPYFTGPVAALGVLAFGVVWWFWDRHVLRWLGYVFTVGKEKDEYSTEWNICTVHVTFQRDLHGPAKRWYNYLQPLCVRCWRYVGGETASAKDEGVAMMDTGESGMWGSRESA